MSNYYLPAGYQFENYIIESVLGSGGFGIMYKFMCNLKAIKNQNILKNLEQAFNNLLNTDSLSCSLVVLDDSVT